MDLFQNPSSCLKAKRSRLEAGLWIAKLVLMLMGVVSLLVLLKVAIIPYTFHLLLSTLPRLWSHARTSLTLPFVYIILNFIIITIAASSNYSIPFSHHHHHPKKSEDADSDSDTLITTTLSDTPTTNPTQPAKQEEEQHKEVVEQQEKEEEEEKVVQVVDDDDDGDYDYDKLREFGLSFDKILSSSSSLEKCSNDYFLPDSDDKGDDHDDDGDDNTLEATWRAIMEGQGKTMKPQLKKSDTWSAGGAAARISKAEPFQQLNGQGYDGGGDDDPVAWAQKELRKSETFNDRASLRREKSMTPEELNLRAEAFIKNFNNQMKLQRLESYQRYIKMVNGRA